MADISISTVSIDQAGFKELVADILEDLVTSDTSPLKLATEKFSDYLDQSTDLDSTQKASALADFLKDGYTQVNQQAINASMDLLKTNASLELETKTVEIDYNLKNAQKEKTTQDTLLTAEATALKAKEIEIATANEQATRLNSLELLARLRKQYGYSGMTLASTALGTDAADGAIDKQTKGYDKVNYKDLIKTLNEHISLITNAGGIPPAWMLNTVKILIEMVGEGYLDISGRSMTLVTDNAGVEPGEEGYVNTWWDDSKTSANQDIADVGTTTRPSTSVAYDATGTTVPAL